MSHIFISYSRRDVDLAQKIVTALAENDLDTWIDWKSIPKGEDWEQEIYRGIEEADAFLFLISPDSVASEMCNKEIAHAVKNGKRILPLFIANVDNREIYVVTEKFLHKQQKEEINRRNFIILREGKDDFEKAIVEIRATIQTDYEWLRYHTELQVKALKWQEKTDASRLLRGKELREAEEQLVAIGSAKDPLPTELHRNYVLASQRNEVRQRRQITMGLSFGLAIVAMLAAFAWNQRNNALNSEATAIAEAKAKATALVNEESARATAQSERDRAEEQSRVALSRQIAAQAKLALNRDISLSFLLSIEAENIKDTYEAQDVLFNGLQQYRRLKRILYGHNGAISSLAFNTINGQSILASGSNDGTIILWDFSDPVHPTVLKSLSQAHPDAVESLLFTSQQNGNMLVSGGGKQIIFWKLSTSTNPVQLSILSSPDIPFDNLSLAIAPDKNLLAVGGGTEMNYWDISNLALPVQIGKYPSNPFGPVEIAFDLNEQIFVSQVQHFIEKSRVSDLTKPESVQPLPDFPDFGIVTAAKFWLSPSNMLLAIGTDEGAVQLWEITKDNQLIDLGSPKLSHSSSVVSLEFSPDGKTLVSKGYDETLIIWNLPEQNTREWGSEYLQNKTEDYKNPVSFLEALKGASAFFKSTDMIFSTNGDYLISGNDDGSISIWDLTKSDDASSLLPNPLGHSASGLDNEQVLSLIELNILNDKNAMVTQNGEDNTVKIWDISDLGKPKLISEPIPATRSIFGYNKGDSVLVVGDDHGVVFWNITNPLKPTRLSSLSLPFTKNLYSTDKVYISPNGNILIFAGDQENTISIWDISNPLKADHVSSLGTQSKISALTLHPETNTLAIADCNGGITLWDIANPKMPLLFGQPFSTDVESVACIDQVAFLGKDLLGISVSKNGVLVDVEIWNLANPKNPALLSNEIKDQLTMEFGFSPSRSRIVTANGFGQVIVWDISLPSKPTIFGYITGNIGWATGKLEFNPAGDVLVTNYENRPILWDMDINVWKDEACEIAGRNLTMTEWNQYFPDEPYRIICPQWPVGE